MVPYAVSAAAIVVVDTECGVAQGHVAEALVDQKAMKNFCKKTFTTFQRNLSKKMHKERNRAMFS